MYRTVPYMRRMMMSGMISGLYILWIDPTPKCWSHYHDHNVHYALAMPSDFVVRSNGASEIR